MTPEEQKQYLRKWRRKHPEYSREWMRKQRGSQKKVVKRKSEDIEKRPRRITPDIVKFRKLFGKYPTENELRQFKANEICKTKNWGV